MVCSDSNRASARVVRPVAGVFAGYGGWPLSFSFPTSVKPEISFLILLTNTKELANSQAMKSWESESAAMIADMPRGRPGIHPRCEFGERLAEARQRAGLSQVQVAEALGMSQRTIAHWERKRSPVYPDQLVTLCQLLDMSPEELLGTESPARKRGQESKLRRQVAEIEQLPRSVQVYVSRFLDQVLTAEGQK